MKKTIILLLSAVVIFSCSKKNTTRPPKTNKPPLFTLKTNDNKWTIFDFNVDTTIVLGKTEFQLSKKNGKGIVKAYRVGTTFNNLNSFSGQIYKIDNTPYIYDGSAISICVTMYCVPSDASSKYVLLGSVDGSPLCIGDDLNGDLRLVIKMPDGIVALDGEFNFETPVAEVTNPSHLDCWIEQDPTGRVVQKI